MNNDPLQRFNFIIEEVERVAAAHPELEGKDDPEVEALLNEGAEILRTQIAPAYRELLRDQPEQLAQWEAHMREFEEVEAANTSTPHVAQPLNSSAKTEMSDKELAEKLESISATLDRLDNRQPPDLEVDAALEQAFREMHELADAIHEKCRDFPEELPKWQEFVEYLEEVEGRYKSALEFENSEPDN